MNDREFLLKGGFSIEVIEDAFLFDSSNNIVRINPINYDEYLYSAFDIFAFEQMIEYCESEHDEKILSILEAYNKLFNEIYRTFEYKFSIEKHICNGSNIAESIMGDVAESGYFDVMRASIIEAIKIQDEKVREDVVRYILDNGTYKKSATDNYKKIYSFMNYTY